MKAWLLIPKYGGAYPLGVYTNKDCAIAFRDNLDAENAVEEDDFSLYEIVELELDAPPPPKETAVEDNWGHPSTWRTTYELDVPPYIRGIPD